MTRSGIIIGTLQIILEIYECYRITREGVATIKVKQTVSYFTLCKFRGASREELAQYRKRTIRNKYRGVTAVDPIAEAEERN